MEDKIKIDMDDMNDTEDTEDNSLSYFKSQNDSNSVNKSDKVSSKKVKLFKENELKLIEKIGCGQFGIVYKYYNNVLGYVAVKTVKTLGDDMDVSNFISEFRREIKILDQTRGHPNIINFYGIFLHSIDICSYVLEYVDGLNLKDFVIKNETINHDNIFRGIIRGVAQLHELNIVHSDLKPDNILIDKNNVPKICDFGLSFTVFESIATTDCSNNGTLSYCSPEKIKENSTSLKQDIWSFGCIIYFCFAKKYPYEDLKFFNKLHKIASGETEKIPDFTPEKFKNLIKDCWVLNHKERITAINIIDKYFSFEDECK
ncbi:hypothetical protein HDV06_001125 [Boothiomyces sp. JEL0866]|nr:hypothetical protein HDV06_001125 [Boothiomyces sp. JEL0866]